MPDTVRLSAAYAPRRLAFTLVCLCPCPNRTAKTYCFHTRFRSSFNVGCWRPPLLPSVVKRMGLRQANPFRTWTQKLWCFFWQLTVHKVQLLALLLLSQTLLLKVGVGVAVAHIAVKRWRSAVAPPGVSHFNN